MIDSMLSSTVAELKRQKCCICNSHGYVANLPIDISDVKFWRFGFSLCVVAERYILQQFWLTADTSYSRGVSRREQEVIFWEHDGTTCCELLTVKISHEQCKLLIYCSTDLNMIKWHR